MSAAREKPGRPGAIHSLTRPPPSPTGTACVSVSGQQQKQPQHPGVSMGRRVDTEGAAMRGTTPNRSARVSHPVPVKTEMVTFLARVPEFGCSLAG